MQERLGLKDMIYQDEEFRGSDKYDFVGMLADE